MGVFKKLEEKSAMLFSIAALIIFEVIFFLIGLLSGMFIHIDHYYLFLTIQEAMGAAAAIGILILSGRGKSVLKSRKGFFPSLFVGMYEVVLLIVAFSGVIIQNTEKLLPVTEIVIFVIFMLLVGITEEVFFRGVITDSLLKKYGTSRKGIILSVAASGLLFGLSHLVNLSAGIGLAGVLIQVAQATALGIFFGAVYMRTHNIFAVIFLHSAMDFVSLSSSGLWGVGSVESYIDSFSLVNLAPVLVYLIPSIFLMRASKLDDFLGKSIQSGE